MDFSDRNNNGQIHKEEMQRAWYIIAEMHKPNDMRFPSMNDVLRHMYKEFQKDGSITRAEADKAYKDWARENNVVIPASVWALIEIIWEE